MRSVEASGKTRKEAIQAALDKLGVELHEVKVEILDEGNRGFLGIGSRDVKVRVRIDDGGGEVDAARGNDAGALLQETIHRMGIEADVTTEHLEGGIIRLNVESPDSAILIGRKGKTLASLQYLINRMVSSADEPDSVERIVVDIEGYLSRRRESLEELAHRLAQRAKETNKRVRMKPLDPQERRIIHVTLQDDPDVQTFSVGNAQVRSVVIEPKGYQGTDEADAPSERGGRERGERGDRGERRSGRGRRGGRRGGERAASEPVAARENGPRSGEGAPTRPQPQRENAGGRREQPRREGRGQEGRKSERPEGSQRRDAEAPRRQESRQPRSGQGEQRRSEGNERRRGGGERRSEGARRTDRGASQRSSALTPRSSALLGPSNLRPLGRSGNDESSSGGSKD